MIRPWFRQAAVPWKTTATQTRASGENRVSTKPGVLQRVVRLIRASTATAVNVMGCPVLNGVEDSHGFGVFAAFIVPTGDGGEMAWSAAAPRR